MPFRLIGYDGASYKSQLQANAASIAPVVTIVLYFGEKHWCKERNIKSLMNIPKELDPYVNDYKMEVFEIAWLTDEQLEMFKSDFKVVARFFVNKRRNPDYVADDPTEIQHVDEVLKLLSVMTGDRDYEKVICDEMKGQVKSMCDVAERKDFRQVVQKVVQKVVQRNVSMQSNLQCPLERLRKRSLRSIPKRNTKKLWLL